MDPTWTPYRPNIDLTSTQHRPYIQLLFHQSLFVIVSIMNSEATYYQLFCFPSTTTITTRFLSFSHHHHHITIVFPPPPPPPPHFYCFTSTTTTTTILLFSLPLLLFVSIPFLSNRLFEFGLRRPEFSLLGLSLAFLA